MQEIVPYVGLSLCSVGDHNPCVSEHVQCGIAGSMCV